MSDYRIVVMGSGGVGKSALTLQFIMGNFVEKYDPTIEDSYRKQIDIEGKTCTLDIMDTAGQEEYGALRDQYMKYGEGFVIVYSITSRLSFDSLERLWLAVVRTKDKIDTPLILVGNKCDLVENRAVSTEEGQNLADKMKAPFLEASAKMNTNVKEIFTTLVRKIQTWRKEHSANPTQGNKKKKVKCSVV